MSKFDNNKYKPSLTYTSLLKAIAEVREYGKEKYGSYSDWKDTEDMQCRFLDATLRHINAYLDGEERDKESGLDHLAHAATCIMFIIEDNDECVNSERQNDDRCSKRTERLTNRNLCEECRVRGQCYLQFTTLDCKMHTFKERYDSGKAYG